MLGGARADPVTQLDVIEAVSHIDPAAGWCLFLCADTAGLSGAFSFGCRRGANLPGDHVPTVAGTIMPGKAVPVPGGYRVAGRWSWGSGIRHAEWVPGNTLVVGDSGRPEMRFCLFPIERVEVHDNWNVMGMRGTGSCGLFGF